MSFHTKLLAELDPRQIQSLEILSFEPDIYLANIIIEAIPHRIFRSEGELLKESSQLALKKHFKGMNIKQTFLLHQSVYDEMIGGPVPSVTELRVKIANPDQDYS